MEFISDDFLLTNEKGKILYEKIRDLPIFDYHCHLSPKEIYEDRQFFNLTQLWLEADHYKWRIMRACGIEENLITGNADPYEKFLAFAKILPLFMGNPVYQWAHMELKKYFGISVPINSSTAPEIWKTTSAKMKDGSFSAVKLIERSHVKYIITTDDPVDTLYFHEKIREKKLPFTVLPCFRPDKAINIDNEGFCDFLKALSVSCGKVVNDFESLIEALRLRLDYFIKNGCVSADCSFANFSKGTGDIAEADAILKKKLGGIKLSVSEEDSYKFAITQKLMELFSKKNISLLIHTGVMRNCNSKLYRNCGADAGGDSIGNSIDIEAARALFDRVNDVCGLPNMTVFTLNSNSYYPIATLLGDFTPKIAGGLQLGAAWWFMDHRDGIREQLKILSCTSGLGLFNGMLTDSRSFVSYVRHDYFRRILCSLIGEWAEAGEIPDDMGYLSDFTAKICYSNAENYFRRSK